VHGPALEGERVLIVEDEPLIALDVRAVLEREGAAVFLAPTIPQALQCTNNPVLTAGVLDIQVGREDAEPVCEALCRRKVPFVFFTGFSARLVSRWPAAPFVMKPAAPTAIIGALKFALSEETRGIMLEPQRGQEDPSVARIDNLILEAEERIERMRRAIARLRAMGFDNSAAEGVLVTMVGIVENLRAHQRMAASARWRRAGR
jgi:DNA-binding response OmpR family regulator